MACQIGITTDPDRRRREWRSQRPTLRNWRILSTHRSKSAAQREESKLAARSTCSSHAGGVGPERATWYVYRFTF